MSSLRELTNFASFQELMARVDDRIGQELIVLKSGSGDALFRAQGAIAALEWLSDQLYEVEPDERTDEYRP